MDSIWRNRQAAALQLVDADRDWLNGRADLTLPERVAPLLERCSGTDPALRAAVAALASHAERTGAALAERSRELPYHNRGHLHDVLIGWSRLCATEQTGLDGNGQLLVMAAMVGHDFCHDGTINRHPYQLEVRAWREMQPILAQAGVSWHQQRAIMAVVLATDPRSYRRLAARGLDTALRRSFALAIGADLFASLLPRQGFAAGHLLACEQRAAGLDAQSDRLATLAGRAAFLRQVPGLGAAGATCGIALLIERQLAVITAMPEAERARPWDAAFGAAFADAVRAALAAPA